MKEQRTYLAVPLSPTTQPLIRAAGVLFSEHRGRVPLAEWEQGLGPRTSSDQIVKVSAAELPKYAEGQSTGKIMIFPVIDNHVYETVPRDQN